MCGDTICNVLQDVLKGNCVSVESETIIRVYMLILYISNIYDYCCFNINPIMNNQQFYLLLITTMAES